MHLFDALKSLIGTWEGTYQLQEPFTNQLVESRSVASLTPLLNGRFFQMTYTWALQEDEQEGLIIFGHERESDTLTATWIDSWHMSDKVMVLREVERNPEAISVMGYYAAPPGPDWGWRTVLTPDTDSFQMTMYNVTPDGEETFAVGVTYRRA